jgi:hypothetical protein
MMLIVLIHNDGTGTNESANYDFEVLVNKNSIARGKVAGHNRNHGWKALLLQIATSSFVYGDFDEGAERKG